MQKVIAAENSDLFDVLAYVACAADPVTRSDRAAAASAATAAELTDKQQAFVDFVLAQYVKQVVGELDAEKLSPLLRLRCQALSDAFAELGKPEQVRQVFVEFQQHLYGAGIKGSHGAAFLQSQVYRSSIADTAAAASPHAKSCSNRVKPVLYVMLLAFEKLIEVCRPSLFLVAPTASPGAPLTSKERNSANSIRVSFEPLVRPSFTTVCSPTQ